MTTTSPVGTIGLPKGRMLCKTCGQRFTFARDLINHIVAIRDLHCDLPENHPELHWDKTSKVAWTHCTEDPS